MEHKREFRITLPEEWLEALGIDEDTFFEAYFDDGSIRIGILDEDELESEFEGIRDFCDEVPEECAECPYYCWHCHACTIDE